jgi:hypothetical protein
VVRNARERCRVKTEKKRAWLVALIAMVLAMSFSGWQKWQEVHKTEDLLQTFEAHSSRPPELVKYLAEVHPNRIFLQIRDVSQRKAAKAIQEMLEKNHFTVPGIEKLMRGPSGTEVRYFRDNEAEQAQKIANLLSQQKIPNVTTKYIAGFETSTSIPKGQFEIWFAPDAFQ